MSMFDNLKEMVSLAQEVGKMELYQKAVDLMRQVTELAQENFELKQEVTHLKAEIKTIRTTKEVENRLEFRQDKYYLKQSVEGEHPGPYCVKCISENGKLVPLSKAPPAARRLGFWQCATCSTFYPH